MGAWVSAHLTTGEPFQFEGGAVSRYVDTEEHDPSHFLYGLIQKPFQFHV
jgi:hypothetical protein